MTRPSFAGTLLTMTQAIGMDQVGRLETMRGARRGERSTVPSSQLATELLASSQKDERPLLRGSRCRWRTGVWVLTAVSATPPPQRQVALDRLWRLTPKERDAPKAGIEVSMLFVRADHLFRSRRDRAWSLVLSRFWCGRGCSGRAMV